MQGIGIGEYCIALFDMVFLMIDSVQHLSAGNQCYFDFRMPVPVKGSRVVCCYFFIAHQQRKGMTSMCLDFFIGIICYDLHSPPPACASILYYHTINSCLVLIFYGKCIPVQYCAYFNQDNEGVYVKHGVSWKQMTIMRMLYLNTADIYKNSADRMQESLHKSSPIDGDKKWQASMSSTPACWW